MLVNGIHINGEEVEYAVGDRRYTILVLLDGTQFRSSRNLEKICERLGLLRTHKSSAVNPTYISGFSEDGVQMQSGFTAQISRRRKIEILGPPKKSPKRKAVQQVSLSQT
ncbi:LytTR family transcriptional regulator DNA-binding domain-containing protein [Runella sp.]|jgi:DNA-binding LytR/AlgR family response regulator|uniref:LytTR family transcriptional regulator DNA-binding domain-containing protein n=1 Tax=Runella sp. TaxID=1960881 RepID=UPI0038F66B67